MLGAISLSFGNYEKYSIKSVIHSGLATEDTKPSIKYSRWNLRNIFDCSVELELTKVKMSYIPPISFLPVKYGTTL